MEKSTFLSQESSLEKSTESTLDKPTQAPVGVNPPAALPDFPPVALTAEEVAFIAKQKAQMAHVDEQAEKSPMPSPEPREKGSKKAKKWEK